LNLESDLPVSKSAFKFNLCRYGVANFLLLNIKYGVQKLLEVDLLNLQMVRTLQGILGGAVRFPCS
jgi:hypothetical protein